MDLREQVDGLKGMGVFVGVEEAEVMMRQPQALEMRC